QKRQQRKQRERRRGNKRKTRHAGHRSRSGSATGAPLLARVGQTCNDQYNTVKGLFGKEPLVHPSIGGTCHRCHLTSMTHRIIITRCVKRHCTHQSITRGRTIMILDPAITIARKSALAYVGAIALTGDMLSAAVEKLAWRGESAARATRMRLGATAGEV